MKKPIKEQISKDYLSGTLDQLHAEVIVPCLTDSIDSLFEVVATYLNDADVANALKKKYLNAIESCRDDENHACSTIPREEHTSTTASRS